MIEHVQTNFNGFYHIALEPGKYRIWVSLDGFDSINSAFTVNFFENFNFFIGSLLPKYFFIEFLKLE